MAYWLVTVLEQLAGTRKQAAQQVRIDGAILSTLGRLSSTAGDALEGRKYVPGGAQLTGTEKQWMEEVVKRLVLRLGEHASGAPLTQITVQQFPLL